MKFPNRVAQFREQRGLSREQLAEVAGVTRQTIGLIEAGKVCPSTVVSLRISKCLCVSVEKLFADPDEIWPLLGALEDGEDDTDGDSDGRLSRNRQRVWAGERNGRGFVRPVDESKGWNRRAHAIWQRPENPREMGNGAGKDSLTWLTAPSTASQSVFVSGCDVGLGLLVDSLEQRTSAAEGVWFEVSNQRALWELQNGLTHVAAIHGAMDGTTKMGGAKDGHSQNGFSDFLASTSPLSPEDYVIVQFASAQMGWMVRRGNPQGFQSAVDLGSGRLRFVNRPRGSGARSHVDKLLARAGVDCTKVTGYNIEADGHAAVAGAISQGMADVGFGHSAAAASRGLTFIPVMEEVCALLIPRTELQHSGVQALLDTLHSDRFLQELCALGPYQTNRTGTEWSDFE